MHIFMDETGSFSGVGIFPNISLVGALIMPSARIPSLERKWVQMRAALPKDKGEVKGRLLNEQQVASIIPLLHHHEALFEVFGIDLGAHTTDALLGFQKRWGAGITAGLTDEHKDFQRKELHDFRAKFEALSLPLLTQSVVTFEIIRRIVECAPMYFSQRRPEELGAFHWVIDAKGDNLTPTGWEDWWSHFILPFLTSETREKPVYSLPAGDYSHMKRFEMPSTPFMRAKRPDVSENAPAQNIGMILGESMKFSIENEPGIELVDIITNATRRALMGNLKEPGWRDIPRLMIHRNTQYINLISLQSDPIADRVVPYKAAIAKFRHGGRIMSTRRTLKSKWYGKD